MNKNSLIKHFKSFLGCYIHIKPGSGGIDAENWSYILLRMYIKWANLNKYYNKIIDKSFGINCSIKSVTLQINGSEVYNYLFHETGIHRLVRKNPLKKSNKRQTSFSSVFIYPIIPEKTNNLHNLHFLSKDIKTEFFRSSGAGGQHVNCTDSAVRLTHIPTGLSTQCQSQRSQHQNKKLAFNQLKSKLYLLKVLEEEKNKKLINKEKLSIQRGNHIRSYVLDDNRIKDFRTGKVIRNVNDVLNGKLDFLLFKKEE